MGDNNGDDIDGQKMKLGKGEDMYEIEEMGNIEEGIGKVIWFDYI